MQACSLTAPGQSARTDCAALQGPQEGQ
uniref:Uncharacterized protein n=1 Tax=Arundo donax TaxID=35708 RepID=A0A0A9BFF8_ARUDO